MQVTLILINDDGSTTPAVPVVQPGDTLIWFNNSEENFIITIPAGYVSLTSPVTIDLEPNKQSDPFTVLRFGLSTWTISYGVDPAPKTSTSKASFDGGVGDPPPKEIVVRTA
jgi:hypothetical protein